MRCPACKAVLPREFTTFSPDEKAARGKNEHCPHCGIILWIPAAEGWLTSFIPRSLLWIVTSERTPEIVPIIIADPKSPASLEDFDDLREWEETTRPAPRYGYRIH